MHAVLIISIYSEVVLVKPNAFAVALIIFSVATSTDFREVHAEKVWLDWSLYDAIRKGMAFLFVASPSIYIWIPSNAHA